MSLLTAVLLSLALAQPSCAVVQSAAQEAAPAARITEAQLRDYFDKSLLLTASQQHIQEGLAQTRKTLPPWFPEKVWVDVQQAVAAVDLVKLILPVYQRYFTQQEGDAIILRFDGPTGHEYAEAALKARLAAVHSGLEGGAAEAAAMSAPDDGAVEALRRRRFAELTPEQLAQVEALARSHPVGDGLKIDDEQNVVISTKLNEVLHATLAAHDAELRAAQRAYGARHG